MRVGVLGGTFDPVHTGHLILAEHAAEGLGLDMVLFIPAGDPWRKEHKPAPAQPRLAMLKLAVEGNDRFGISDIELRRAGPTYTADTLETLAAERLDDEFWFIVGADALADLPNWHEPERILRHATLAVAPRPDELPPAASIAASGRTLGGAGVTATLPGIEDRIARFPMPRIDISSTDIRARIAEGGGIRYLVPDAVRAYITHHRLYSG